MPLSPGDKLGPYQLIAPIVVSKTATAVLDASGGLAFPGEIQEGEASVLTGHLDLQVASARS
jgi:hypothetical protein